MRIAYINIDEVNLAVGQRPAATLKNQACCYWRLSSLYETSGRLDQAADCAADAVRCWGELLERDSANYTYRSRLGLALKEQVRLEIARGRPRAAEACIRRAVLVLTPIVTAPGPDMESLWGAVWLAEVYREWGLLLMAPPTEAKVAIERYTKAIQILDKALAREPQLLRGRVVQSQIYTYRSMAHENLDHRADVIRDREQSCVYADGTHHYICQVDLARFLARYGDHRRAVIEARAGAARADLPPIWRVTAARAFSLAAAAADKDPTLSAAERTSLVEEYGRLAVVELERCRAAGYFKDRNNRKELTTDPHFEAIRRRPDFGHILQTVA